ncbi:MAG: helicase-exonuclease AddAB subunit AddB [Clostridiales bacterium]|nr:helicase-exonuclease AddAB subunit AddB [Clostridiales bacterium]
MSLQLIIGSGGSGKSYRMYEKLIEESIVHPEESFIVIVPEQYTMQTQKNIVSMHPRHGVMNIDIVSFGRLAYRVFEELGVQTSKILEDTGKRMVIRKVLENKRGELTVFSGSVRKSGFCGELKSMISELLQYNISPKRLNQCMEQMNGSSVLFGKLKDLSLVYQSFKEYIEGHYLTAEEILTCLCPYLEKSQIIRESRIYLDNFTGFTPAQYMVMAELLKYSKGVEMTLTIDVRSLPYELKNNYELFYLTKETVWRLEKLCREIHCDRKEDILLDGAVGGRFEGRPDLRHLEQNIYRKKAAVFKEEPEHLFLFCAKNPANETRHIARQIRRLVRDGNYRYREIAVICGDVAGYRHMVEKAFAAMDIPCFIDVKRSVLNNAFVECLRAMLEMFADNFSYESVFRYLRSGFSDIARENVDLLENYVMAFGIRGASSWQNTWMKRPGNMDDAMLLALNQTRERVFERLWPVYDVFKDKGTAAGERTACLKTWIYEENIKEKLLKMAAGFETEGKLSMAREYTQVFDVVMDLLDKLGEILKDEKVSIREYGEILDAGLNEEKMGLIPPGIDEVTVGDIQRTRLAGIKVLFFMGVNEGIVPGKAKEGGLINDREKELLLNMDVELAPTARQMGYFEQFYIYAALSKACDYVYLSYSQVSAQGKALRPSSLLRRLHRIFPALKTKECEQENGQSSCLFSEADAFDYLVEGIGAATQEEPGAAWKELYSWFLQRPEYEERLSKVIDAAFISYVSRPLSREAVAALYGKELSNSVTTLENYAACAYAHFLQYGLGLLPREENKIQTPDLGIILHRALEMFAAALKKQGYTWKDVPEDVRESVGEQCAIEAAKSFNHTALLETKRNQYQIKRLVRYVLRTTWAVKQQLSRGEFLPEAFELRFDSDALSGLTDVMLGDDGRMKLKGTIDRIDLCEVGDNLYVKIVDYKSGNQRFDIAALYYGLSLQLVIYMNAARAMEEKEHPGKRVIPAGILYYNIDDPMIERADFSEVSDPEAASACEDEILVKLKSNGLINASPDVIRLFDREFTKDSPVIPVSLTASGALSKRSSVATLKQFDDLGRFAAGKVETLGKEILSGNIGIHPYMKGNKKACTYCLFQSICEFDERIDGFSYRRLGDLDAKAAWEEIRRWNEAGADSAGKDGGSRPPAPAGSETASGGSGRPAPVDSEAAAGGSGRPEPADSIKEVKGHGGEVDG